MKYLEARYPDGRLHGTTCATPEFEARYRLNMAAMGLTVTAYTLDESRQLMDERRRARARQASQQNCAGTLPPQPQPTGLPRTLAKAANLQADPPNVVAPWLEGPFIHRGTRATAQDHAAGIATHREFAGHLLLGRALDEHGWAMRAIENHRYAVKRQAEMAAQFEREQRHQAQLERDRAAGLELPAVGAEIVSALIGGYGVVSRLVDYRDGRILPEATGPGGTAVIIPWQWRPASAADRPINRSPLPVLGQRITHVLIGAGVVTHTVTLDGQAVPVMVGPRGSSLVRPGEWRPAADVMSPETPKHRHEPPTCRVDRHEPLEAAPPPVTEDHPPAQASPKPSRMPSLF